MLKRFECKVCHKHYDSLEKMCPNCGEPNPNIKQGFWGSKVIATKIWKQVVLFLIGWVGFQVIGTGLNYLFFLIASFAYTNEASRQAFLKSVEVSSWINFIAYLLLFIIFAFIIWKDWKKIFLSFKRWVVPISAVIGFVSIILFNITYRCILSLFGVSIADNENENSLNEIIKLYPLISILIFGVIGPFCEEITYRLGLFSFLKRINTVLAFVLTMIVFALIHFDFGSIGTDAFFNELLNLPFYFSAAFVFTFLYEKFGFAASFSCHAINNIYSVVGTIILNLIN